jgi:hypothetical protein
MSKNVGKIFEESIKNSMPDYTLLIRLNDSPQAFKQSKLTRFTPRTPFDYICFDTNSRTLYCLELKTTKFKSISFEDINNDEEENKMIHRHQIIGLTNYSIYNNVCSGFLFNFRDEKNNIERTYFQEINDFISMTNKINKKSFNELDLIVDGNAIKINGEKKRTRFQWNMDEFFKNMNERHK